MLLTPGQSKVDPSALNCVTSCRQYAVAEWKRSISCLPNNSNIILRYDYHYHTARFWRCLSAEGQDSLIRAVFCGGRSGEAIH